jgi:hypothetical protein
MSWLFSQALVEEYSAGTSLAGEPCAQLNVMPTLHKFWRNDKTIDASDHSRFGLTSQLLTDAHGAELLMSYLADFPARTSVQQELASELRDREADFGATKNGSFAKYDHDTSTWRTVQCSLLGDSDVFSETWPRWGSMSNGVSYLRPIPALPICVIESGLWPTPTVCGNYNRKGVSKSSGDGLATAVRMWRTPNASDANKWSKQSLEERKAKGQQIRLNTQVSPDGSKAGLLNPDWIEWLMGWPIGWTELKPLAMARFQEWQQQHGGF